jgi:gliding motility-associated-like protein
MNKSKAILLFVFGLWSGISLAQNPPSNDDCNNPIVINNVTNYCSPVAAFTNVNATPSSYSPSSCFGATTGKDVWFAFRATATDVSITVRGNTDQGPGGTLEDPQVSLYFGTCGGTINELECQSSQAFNNITEAYQGGLFVGSIYLIRIQGRTNQSGTFQLCITNYNPPVEPTSDCPKSSILCDKSPFVVKKVTGAGTNNKEMEDAVCFDNGSPGIKESNSTWFVWTCSKSGTLEFALTPLNAPDDLDFVIYRLPNGIGNCNGKLIERCMASGLSQNQQFPSPCLGPTGLKAGDPDISEDAGCSEAGDDAWLKPLDMVQGVTYALVVNNFSNTGNGFSISFGGTGEFLGPDAQFKTIPDAVCLGTPVQVFDASTFALGQITKWEWSFGADAVPQTANGPGPHNVQFNSSGDRPIVLRLETNLGCKVTDIETVKIYPDVEVDTLIAAPDCNGTSNGAVEISNIISGTPPYQFSWNSGPFITTNKLENLKPGPVTLKIKDKNNCETDLSIDVKERILTADGSSKNPLCFGEKNGEITMIVTNGKPPVQYNWGNGFVGNNIQGGFTAGVYTIQGIDGVLCKGTFTVTVTDNPKLELEVIKTDISCFGANDGTATASSKGGVGNFMYEWSNGKTTSKISDLGPGTYTVTVSDGNECNTTQSVTIVEPADVGVRVLDVKDLLCNGVPTGSITVEGLGGRQPYQFSTNGVNYQPSPTLANLKAGTYFIKIKDGGGCIDSVQAVINEPIPLEVFASPKDTSVELGTKVGFNALFSPAGRRITYDWTPSLGLDNAKTSNPELTATNTQTYIVKITDEDNCMAFDTIRVIVKKDRPIYIPNVFKPSSNTFNDRFTVFGNEGAEQITLLRVYDRWGDLVFETRGIPLGDPSLGWDGTYKGKPVDGVFTFYTFVRFIDAVELQYEGNVTVVR